jgi:DnaJ-class molecular chaperone
MEKDYYKTLNLTEKSSLQEIEQAFTKLSSEWHPEKHSTDRVEAHQRFNEICEAYYVLSDSARRSNYDLRRSQKFSVDDAHRVFERFFT